MDEMKTQHAVILDAEGVYHSEVVSNIATIEANVPEGGSYTLLPETTPSMISSLLFPHNPGFIAPPAE